MIELTINEKKVKVKHPVTIIEAAEMVSIEIPRLCYFKGLSPFGGCRLCLVEVENIPKLQTSCTVKVTEGMIVRTESDVIYRSRKTMLELLLINHPLDCPVCDKAGECKLQDYSYKYGAAEGRFLEKKRRHSKNLDDPIILNNMNRCILCTRCVRVCEELQGISAITVAGRGGNSLITPFSEEKYNCEYCGNCLTVCPVGAITSRLHMHTYRPWYVDIEVETICCFCGVGCSLFLQMRGDSIIRTIPKVGAGLNNGLLCVRGRFGYDYIESDGRLNTPLIKDVEHGLRPAGWEEAIIFAAKRFKEIIKEHGSKAVGAIASGRCTNEDNYMLQKFIRFVVGSNNIDATARFYYAPAVAFLEEMLGQGITANLIPGIANADGVFVVGGDPTVINPILGLQIRLSWRNGGKVIVLGMADGLKKVMDYNLITDHFSEEIALSSIVGKLRKKATIVNNNNIIEDKINKLKIPTEDEITAAGLSFKYINEVTNTLLKMKKSVIVIGPDIIQRKRATKNLFLLGAIAYLINSKLFILSEKPNYQGLIDMGCMPDTLPGGISIDDKTFRNKIELTHGFKISNEKGLNLFEMLEEAKKGNLKALYIMGENPLSNFPNKQMVMEVLNRVEFLIVQDIFNTETAKIADVVLPATSWGEKEGTYTNLGRKIQRIRRGKDNHGINLKHDWQILSDIANQMGMKEVYLDAEEVWKEITRISPLHKRIKYENLSEKDFFMWPYCSEPIKYMESDFTVEGLEELPYYDSIDNDCLILKRSLFSSGTTSNNSKALRSISLDPYLAVNPVYAQKKGLKDSEWVRISTETGSVELSLKIEENVPQNTVILYSTLEKANDWGLIDYSVDTFIDCLVENNYINIEKTA